MGLMDWDCSGLGWEQVEGSCESGNEPNELL
jgi:hypothetical protein